MNSPYDKQSKKKENARVSSDEQLNVQLKNFTNVTINGEDYTSFDIFASATSDIYLAYLSIPIIFNETAFVHSPVQNGLTTSASLP